MLRRGWPGTRKSISSLRIGRGFRRGWDQERGRGLGLGRLCRCRGRVRRMLRYRLRSVRGGVSGGLGMSVGGGLGEV